jgi:hypothetical protein
MLANTSHDKLIKAVKFVVLTLTQFLPIGRLSVIADDAKRTLNDTVVKDLN